MDREPAPITEQTWRGEIGRGITGFPSTGKAIVAQRHRPKNRKTWIPGLEACQ
jgi:hypothetical protein